ASLFGQWPGAAPTNLATLTFDIAEGATGSTPINFSASSNAAGFTFAGQSQDLVISAEAEHVESQLSINAATGEVSLATDPDYEAQSEYSFNVTATDAAGNASQQAVTLAVNDLDEIAPVITSGESASVDESASANQVVYIASSDDSEATYSLTADSDAALSIDENSGAVTLASDPDHEAQDQYNFTVVATDTAGNASQQAGTLAVNDLDEIAPTITSGDVAAIDENSGAAQVIYTATADDSADTSGGISFSLAAGSDAALSIDAVTGAVTLAADPNYEAQDQYSFTVVATDTAGNASQQAVTLEVGDLDEVAPTITSGDTAAAINENSGATQVVYTATADDADYNGVEPVITYSLSDNDAGAFSIDASTGQVALLVDPDYEAQSEYSFTVVATDAAGNQSDAKAVTISINDIDDFVLAGKVYHWGSQALLENVAVTMHNQASGAEMASVATDSDGGFTINDLAADEVVVSVERDLQAEDLGRLVTSADALAALKIAVDINPNATNEDGLQQRAVSPYQYIAADVNKSGQVTSADVLEILKMAVKMPNVTPVEWLFVAESQDFWDETAGEDALTIDRLSVAWDSDGTEISLTESAEMNFVGVILGDVSNNWQPLEGSQAIEYSHFETLEDQGVAPLYQWGLASQATDGGVTVVAEEFVPMITSGSLVILEQGADSSSAIYTVSSNLSDATFSMADATTYASVGGGSAETVVSIPDLSGSQQQLVYVSAST
ncbi:MAG: cadherin domain-containing protein, partial [Porticoccaceae bacterium]|nr:cadherin domain-containing protein [Porticoccaceae bacterium]